MREVYRISEFEVSTVVDGFWIVQYEGVQARGGAVAVLTKGQIFGGDSGFTYIGDYQTDGNSLKARVIVRNFLPDVPSIFGVQGDYELSLVGTVEGDVIKGKAVLVGRPGVGIVVRLTERIRPQQGTIIWQLSQRSRREKREPSDFMTLKQG